MFDFGIGEYFIIGSIVYSIWVLIIFFIAYATKQNIELVFPFNVIDLQPGHEPFWGKYSTSDRVAFHSMAGILHSWILWPLALLIFAIFIIFMATKDIFIMFFSVDPESIRDQNTQTKSIKLKKRVVMWLSILLYIGAMPAWITLLPDINGSVNFSMWYSVIFVGHILYIATTWGIISRTKK